MTVFKAFLRVLKKNIGMVILYTVILVTFAGANLQTGDNSTNFVASKPDVIIISNDNSQMAEGLTEYLNKNCNIKDLGQDAEDIEDALFYREANYVIYIPQNFGKSIAEGKNPQIQVKSTGDYQASYAELLVNRYMKMATSYAEIYKDEEQISNKIKETLSNEAKVEMTTKLDTDATSRVAFYYNFANYSLMAGGILVISLIMSSFREKKVRRRISISSMNYKRHNRILLIANGLFGMVLWAFYVILSFILLDSDIMVSTRGLMYILNSFVFTISVVTLAFLIANLVESKNAISGIVNVIALGSSFLCGCFVPVQWLPDIVLKIAHIFPSYWYINTNDRLASMETINFDSMRPVLVNMAVVLGFSALFVIVTNVLSRKKMEE